MWFAIIVGSVIIVGIITIFMIVRKLSEDGH